VLFLFFGIAFLIHHISMFKVWIKIMFMFDSLKLILVVEHHLMHALIHVEIWLVEKIRIESIFFWVK
jgi:hypothetical protein